MNKASAATAKGIEIKGANPRTIALQGMLVLQDPAFIDQPLLLRRDVALLDEGSLEGPDGGIEGDLHRELGPVRASDVDGDGGASSDGVRIASAAGIAVGAHVPYAKGDRTPIQRPGREIEKRK